ncbi:hypothetical protein GQ42DRAFT_112892, partial [Ramicandelaber brevisporus]
RFLETVLEESLPDGDLQSVLKDGSVLCKALNTVRPGAVSSVGNKPGMFVMMENITRFLDGCRRVLGLPNTDLFETQDLYNGRDMNRVINTILAMER